MYRNQISVLILLLILPVFGYSQDITGLWKGTIYNDTFRIAYQYEIAISEEKGKLSGYSHTWFILDNKQYFGVKKLKIKREKGKIITEDAGLVAHNYPETPPKGVKQLNVLDLSSGDSLMKLAGPFSTNRTRKYRPMTGFVQLQRKNDYWQSSLVPHLQELGLAQELAFVNKDELVVNTEPKLITKRMPEQKGLTGEVEKKDASASNTVAKNNKVTDQESGNNKTPAETGKDVVLQNKNSNPQQVPVSPISIQPKLAVKNTSMPAENVLHRNTVVQQTVQFSSDSLLLSLYDNGEVDGDTVSVLMNGNIIMAKQRLSSNATQKTIYLTDKTDSLELIMYAENLGSIPPNTGLLVVRDGKDIYEIRFSGDYQKNAAIIFKRKK